MAIVLTIIRDLDRPGALAGIRCIKFMKTIVLPAPVGNDTPNLRMPEARASVQARIQAS
jgi:hypothetical protein